jgi:hypothetical protein
MGARKTDPMTLYQAYLTLAGAARPPGDTLAQRDAFRDGAYWVLRSAVAQLSGGDSITMRPAEWDRMANDPGTAGGRVHTFVLPNRELQAMIRWIASAPEKYTGFAVEMDAWCDNSDNTSELYRRLLRGDAGPHARAVVPEAGLAQARRISALLELPQHELEAITAPHAGAWPCYADRLIAASEVWHDRESKELLKALVEISSEDAAEWATWLPVRHDISLDVMRLLTRIHPSPQMLEIVERFGEPEVIRELYASQVARQLETERPGQDDDLLPQAEMI